MLAPYVRAWILYTRTTMTRHSGIPREVILYNHSVYLAKTRKGSWNNGKWVSEHLIGGFGFDRGRMGQTQGERVTYAWARTTPIRATAARAGMHGSKSPTVHSTVPFSSLLLSYRRALLFSP